LPHRLAAGLAISFALARVVSSLLFGVSATDPLTFVGMAVMLSIVALAASYIPARRAVNIDPMVALRHE
jgi:putative ABC transport system permease protein